MWLNKQGVIYLYICLCSENCFRTDQTRLGYYDVKARLTSMIDCLAYSLSLILRIDSFKLILYYASKLGVNCSYLKFDILNASKRVVS